MASEEIDVNVLPHLDETETSTEKLLTSVNFENDDDEIISTRPKKKRDLKVLESDSEEEQCNELSAGTQSEQAAKLYENVEDAMCASVTDVETVKEEETRPAESENNLIANKYSSLIDSDSEVEDEGEGQRSFDGTESENSQDQETKRNSQPTKMSAKEAMEQRRSIKSESQRLTREMYVSIPYHKPKQHTLKEFMNRRTIAKCGYKQSLSVKMSQEELEEFAKQLEERAKEATVFFKSDSEKIKTENDSRPSATKTAPEVKSEEILKSEEKAPNDLPTDSASKNIQQSSKDLYLSQDMDLHNTQAISTQEADLIAPTPTPNAEGIIDVLKERNFIDSPILTGSPNTIIDLETGDVVSPKPTGADQLFQRFLKHSIKKKPKENSSMSIVSTENGVVEITNVEVPLDEEKPKEQKPGAAYLKLKNNLKKLILEKRKEEFTRKLKERGCNDKENTKEYEAENMESEDLFAEEEYDEFDDEEIGDGELSYRAEEDPKVNDEFKDVEADDEYDSDEGTSDDSDNEDLPEVPKAAKKRIIVACSDSDEDTGELANDFNLIGENKVPWTQEAKITSGDEDELLDLCTGHFDSSQKPFVISQVPMTQCKEKVDEEEFLALCSGVFQGQTQKSQATQDIVQNIVSVNTILESSDEDNDYSVRTKRKKRKLEFSDDEEEHDLDDEEKHDKKGSTDDETSTNLTHEQSEIEDIPETYVEYDSEENEIEVRMTKNDCLKKANEFLENEAELSESEWGSADEDEKDMDRYEADLIADGEEFDKDKLQSELGKIHMRRLLDDDIRDVKKIQEMFFEDEENDGVGRQRQFRWKNLQGGFDLETEAGADGDALQESGDETEEMQWRKMRYEREILLQEKTTETSSPKVKGASMEQSSSSGRKLTILNITKTATAISESKSPFLIARTMQTSRGSFLVRGEEMLTKLANITKTSSEKEDGAVQVRSGKANNFVFAAVVDKVEPEIVTKRKSMNDQGETSSRKKFKPNMKSKLRLIDQLA